MSKVKISCMGLIFVSFVFHFPRNSYVNRVCEFYFFQLQWTLIQEFGKCEGMVYTQRRSILDVCDQILSLKEFYNPLSVPLKSSEGWFGYHQGLCLLHSQLKFLENMSLGSSKKFYVKAIYCCLLERKQISEYV